MKTWTEEQIQKAIDIEIVLVLIAVGFDIFIESIGAGDWIAAAVVIAGFCMIFGLYWHTLFLDSFLSDMHAAMHHAPVAAEVTAPIPTVIPLPATFKDEHAAAQDMPLSALADRPVIRVSDYLASKNFYARTLAPLGYAVTMDFPAISMAAFGIGMASDLWIKRDAIDEKMRASFSADSKRAVDDFFAAALAAGGAEAVAPGKRTDNGARYYAAAVTDPDGFAIEAVFRGISE